MLGALAGAVRAVRFRFWVVKARLRLARLGCKLVVETEGTPRFGALPRIEIDTMGEGRGSLRLRIGRDCRFGRDLILDLWTHTDGVIEIGARSFFQDRVRLQPWGGTIRLGEQTQVRDGAELKSKGELSTGTRAVFGRNTTVHCHERIVLGDHVALAEGVTVMDSDHLQDAGASIIHQGVVATPVTIEDNVFVATNALILRGSRVGANSQIAAGSVLTGGDYPARHLLAGTPAAPVRPLDS